MIVTARLAWDALFRSLRNQGREVFNGPGDFSVTERLGEGSPASPCSGVMGEEQVDHVCRGLRAVIRSATSRRCTGGSA